MKDNDLIKLIIATINGVKAGYGIGAVKVKQSYQPTQQGANSDPTAYLFKIGDKRYGFNKRHDVWVPATATMEHQEIQIYETTFQVNALAIQDPANVNSLTASDIVNTIAAIIHSDYALNEFRKKGVGILRVTDVRNPYFIDDKNRHEASPSFDFVLTHKQTFTTASPVVESVEFNVERI